MPKASLVALLAASAITVIPFNLFAQTAPATAPAAPAAPAAAPAPGSANLAAPAAADVDAEPPPATPPPAATGGAPVATGPLLPGMVMSSGEPTNASQPKSSSNPSEKASESILAEDWWSHSRPIIEMHGYFRTRAEMFYNFSLGRNEMPSQALWAHPTDAHYNGYDNSGSGSGYGATVCTAGTKEKNCSNNTQSSANMRLRLTPEIHVSDNLRIMTQIDILDNLVYGSTPSGYMNAPSGNGYAVVQRNGYTPLSFFDNTTETPSAGVNGFKDSVRVKRAWAEYSSPVGQLRFGRMPDHFGMGMVHNAGDGYDHDYQSTIDRLQFITDVRPLDLMVGASWDFPNDGKTSESLQYLGGQPYDLAQLDDVQQYSLLLMRRKAPQLERMALTRGDVVFNMGAYVTYRSQELAADGSGATGTCSSASNGNDNGNIAAIGCPYSGGNSFARRHASAWTPDLWVQVLYKRFRFEAEAATIQGSIANTNTAGGTSASNYLTAPGGKGWKLNAWGITAQLQQKLVEDKLDLSLGFGWASGDPDVNKGSTSTSEAGDMGLTPGNNGLQNQRGNNTFSTFRFHPSYQMDLILHRNLLTRVQGTYYFRPSVGYDFLRKPNGQRLGGNVAGIWTRASEYTQAPGHARDLGIEANGSIYYQSKDGVLNDRPGTLGGFYTMLQYGVLFPMDGLKYPARVNGATPSAAQILRWYIGVFF